MSKPYAQVTGEITMLLKQQNARAILHLSHAKNCMKMDMSKFADQLLRSLSCRCLCCPACGYTTRRYTTDSLHGLSGSAQGVPGVCLSRLLSTYSQCVVRVSLQGLEIP